MSHKTIIGIIPARGGSKGIPRKNIRPLCGLPLLAYTVKAALQSRLIERVILSTDDIEIAKIGRELGAEVPFIRPSEYATDVSSTISVIHHALTWLQENEGYEPDAVTTLPPTCPLRTKSDIDGTVNLFLETNFDSTVTICPVKNHPYFIYNLHDNGKLTELISIANKPLRRQDLPTYYTHSQAVIVAKFSYLKKADNSSPVFNFNSVAGFEITVENSLDIDDMNDFHMAEIIMKKRLQLLK